MKAYICYLAYPQAEPVNPVKDPTSDMPQIARKGSNLVKEYRQKRDESKSRERFWEVAGSKMGNIIGETKKEGEGAEDKPEDPDMAGESNPPDPL